MPTAPANRPATDPDEPSAALPPPVAALWFPPAP